MMSVERVETTAKEGTKGNAERQKRLQRRAQKAMLKGILDEVLKAGSGLLSGLRGRPNLPLKVQIQLQGAVQRPSGCSTVSWTDKQQVGRASFLCRESMPESKAGQIHHINSVDVVEVTLI